ncbi:MAG: hypothetical protein FWG10_12515 [Eubacteriaceae bacterium]|nr:hypothetical protein [Eubacteriaceae bacterium]
MGTKRKLATFLCIVFCLALFAGCKKAAALAEYEFGDDKIPSVNAVLGEDRKVIGTGTGTTNGVRYKEYKYQTETMRDDMVRYVIQELLGPEGWLAISDFNFDDLSGEGKIAKNSLEEGKILIMTITFDLTTYNLKIEKGQGTLTPN